MNLNNKISLTIILIVAIGSIKCESESAEHNLGESKDGENKKVLNERGRNVEDKKVSKDKARTRAEMGSGEKSAEVTEATQKETKEEPDLFHDETSHDELFKNRKVHTGKKHGEKKSEKFLEEKGSRGETDSLNTSLNKGSGNRKSGTLDFKEEERSGNKHGNKKGESDEEKAPETSNVKGDLGKRDGQVNRADVKNKSTHAPISVATQGQGKSDEDTDSRNGGGLGNPVQSTSDHEPISEESKASAKKDIKPSLSSSESPSTSTSNYTTTIFESEEANIESINKTNSVPRQPEHEERKVIKDKTFGSSSPNLESTSYKTSTSSNSTQSPIPKIESASNKLDQSMDHSNKNASKLPKPSPSPEPPTTELAKTKTSTATPPLNGTQNNSFWSMTVRQFFTNLSSHPVLCAIFVVLVLLAIAVLISSVILIYYLFKSSIIALIMACKKMGVCIKDKKGNDRLPEGSLFPRCDVRISPYVEDATRPGSTDTITY